MGLGDAVSSFGEWFTALWGGSDSDDERRRLSASWCLSSNATRRRLDDCVNDDSTPDSDGDTCTDYYDSNHDDYECGIGDWVGNSCCGADDFAASVQCCACGGGTRCDIVVSGSSLPELHGTYEQKGSCNDYPLWKCDEDGGCDQDQYIWYYSDYSNWHIRT